MTPLFKKGDKSSAANYRPVSLTCICSSAAKRSTNNQYVCKYKGRINDQSNWSGPFSLVVMTLDYRSRGTWFDPRSRHSTGLFSLQVCFSSYYIWCREQDDYRRSSRAMQWQRSPRMPGNSRKHLIQMFHCRMEECSSAAKRSTNNQYVCKYIGRINDQSNWSGPFSLVVMTLDYRSRGTWFDPQSGHSTGIFSLQVYFSSYYISCVR